MKSVALLPLSIFSFRVRIRDFLSSFIFLRSEYGSGRLFSCQVVLDPLRSHGHMPAFPVDSPCSFTFSVAHALVITVGFLLEIFFRPHLALPPDAFFCWLKSSTVICGFPEREPPWSGGESRLHSKPGVSVPNRALILE